MSLRRWGWEWRKRDPREDASTCPSPAHLGRPRLLLRNAIGFQENLYKNPNVPDKIPRFKDQDRACKWLLHPVTPCRCWILHSHGWIRSNAFTKSPPTKPSVQEPSGFYTPHLQVLFKKSCESLELKEQNEPGEVSPYIIDVIIGRLCSQSLKS